MKTWMLWSGGVSYGPGTIDEDTEEFHSLSACKEAFYRRERGPYDPYYPCVEGSSAHVFFSDPRGVSDPYPDRVLSIGPRGGLLVELA